MSASRRRDFIAHNWPLRLALTVTTIGSAAAVGVFYCSRLGVPRGVGEALAFVGYLVVAGLLGFFSGSLVATFVIGPFYYEQGLENGAPYEPGDRVRVLVGRHRGRIAPVYAVWSERNQVRVELSDAERASLTDVFSYVEVCREAAEALQDPA